MKIAGKIAAAFAVSAAAALAGCQMGPGGSPSRPGPITPPPGQGIEGNWIDQAGTGITVFRGGTFETIASDSGSRLSEGSYRTGAGGIVEISGMSIIRQTAVSFNCARATPIQLNCTAASGQQFILTRYSGQIPSPPPAADPPLAGQQQPVRG